MNLNVVINKRCMCLRGKKGMFVRGKEYKVHNLYQMPDGDMMVSVDNEAHWLVNCYAKRFLLPKINYCSLP